jgi:hypothetical protein
VGIRLFVEVMDHAPVTLTHREAWVLGVLAEDANDRTRTCWPGIEDEPRIAHRMRLPARSSRYEVLKALKAKGALEVLEAGRRGHRAVYRIPHFAPVANPGQRPENPDPNSTLGPENPDPTEGFGSGNPGPYGAPQGPENPDPNPGQRPENPDPNSTLGPENPDPTEGFGSGNPGPYGAPQGPENPDPNPGQRPENPDPKSAVGSGKPGPLPLSTTEEDLSPAPRAPRAPEVDEDAFAAFWATYPRRVAKADALKAFTAAVKAGADPAHLTTAAARHHKHWIAEGRQPKYFPYPASWLRKGSYDDELTAPQPAAPQQPAHQTYADRGIF